MSINICYKVVRIFNDRLYSCIVSNIERISESKLNYTLEYKLNEKTKCIDGTFGIFCFDDFSNALGFRNNNNCSVLNLKIFICEGFGEIKKPSKIPKCDLIDAFYKKIYKFTTDLIPVPEGTICFKSIKLLKEIDLDFLVEYGID